jgi:hypothetical protein
MCQHHIPRAVPSDLADEVNITAKARKRHCLIKRVSSVTKANLLRRSRPLPELGFVKAFYKHVQVCRANNAEPMVHSLFPPKMSENPASRSMA